MSKELIAMGNEDIEIKLVIEAIRQKYGYDFSHYAKASITRRIKKGFSETGLFRISEMIPKLLYDRKFFNALLLNLSVNVTEMFRDPSFFMAIRQTVVPYLKTFPFVKIWLAGVASGEEAYSMAILLKEEELLDKVLIYATDFNDAVLDAAQKGVFPAEYIKKSTKNYQKSGGMRSFGTYYHADYDSVLLDRKLSENIVFANHNLVTDGVFGEMNLILCRNVLIYFDNDLQNRVLKLFDDSLCPNGFLCLGSKETIDFSEVSEKYSQVTGREKIYQKKVTGG